MIISSNFANINQYFFVNNPLTFALVYANGMLGALAYVSLTKNRKRNTEEGMFFTLIAIGCIIIYAILCSTIGKDLQKWQLDNRFILSVVFTVFIVSTAMSVWLFRKIWDNRIMRFISTISYNLYIWHQFIAVQLKEIRIPYWEGTTPPNMTGDTVWQWKYFLLCIVVSLAVACIMTYAVEKPLYKLITKGIKKCGD